MAARDPPEPIDKFTPHLLHVDVPENLAYVFAHARRIASGEDPDFRPGEKHVAILTPGRAIVSIPAVPKDLVLPATLSEVKTWLGSSLDIAVVSYTEFEALMDKDQGKLKCIPFLPRLGILAAAGYNAVSYTHLDVYKRQALVWTTRSNDSGVLSRMSLSSMMPAP